MSKARGPYRVDPLGYKKANEALDKKAENARELGLDYEPAQQEPEKDWDAVGQAHLAALKKSSKKLVEEAAVRTVHKMAQQQEPVLWMMPDGKTVNKWGLQFYSNVVGTPLYTSPPAQRTWVGLTDEEEVKLWESTDSDWELMKRVEAKLKEKNT